VHSASSPTLGPASASSSSSSCASVSVVRLMFQLRHWLSRSYRDATVVTGASTLPNGTHVCALKSVEHRSCPPSEPYHRFSILTEGFVVQPYRHTVTKQVSGMPPSTPMKAPAQSQTMGQGAGTPGEAGAKALPMRTEMSNLSLDSTAEATTSASAMSSTVPSSRALPPTPNRPPMLTAPGSPYIPAIAQMHMPRTSSTTAVFSQLSFVSDIDLRGRGAPWLVNAFTTERGPNLLAGLKEWLVSNRAGPGGWGADDTMLRKMQKTQGSGFLGPQTPKTPARQ
jgi:hypothetical protein